MTRRPAYARIFWIGAAAILVVAALVGLVAVWAAVAESGART